MNMYRKNFSRISFLVLMLLGADLVMAQVSKDTNTLYFGCGMKPENKVFRLVSEAMTRVLEPLGYQFHMEHYPRVRLPVELEAGRLDGICGRALEYFESSESSIAVRKPVVAYSHLELYGLASRSDLGAPKESDLIVYVRGTLPLKKYLADTPSKSIAISKIEQGLKMVMAGRADYLIEFRETAAGVIHKLNIEEKLVALPTGVYTPVLIALHQRHTVLRNEIEKGLSRYVQERYGSDTSLIH